MQHHGLSLLMRERRFAPFFWTQFLGAANDNLFKFALTLLVTYQAAAWSSWSLPVLVNLIAGLFILPFFLFSALAGQLADKYEKSRLIRLIKGFEVAIMGIALLGFTQQNLTLLFSCIFLLGLHSTCFGPVKYAYLPQHLTSAELIGGNGLVEMGTFVAILLGTIAGGELAQMPDLPGVWIAGTGIGLALLGLATAFGIPKSPAVAPDLVLQWNPAAETWRNLRFAAQYRTVFLSLLGISWLWFVGATFLTQFSPFAKLVLGGNEQVVTALLATFSVGIGLGSLLCDRLSAGYVEIGLVPFGSLGMSFFMVDLYGTTHGWQATGIVDLAGFLAQPSSWRVLADLFLLAMFSGFYSVPLYALIQSRSPASHCSRVIAANNILNALFMIIAAGLSAFILGSLQWSIPQLFLLLGILNIGVAIYIYTLVPEFLVRFIVWLLMHTVYRLKVRHIDAVPAEGPCVLVCNHVSYVDPLIIMAGIRRPVRFVMDYGIYKIPVLHWIFRLGRTIPIASERESAAVKEQAFASIRAALQAGEVICIFPEGRLTQSGKLNAFKPGIKRILEESPVQVVPIALRGLWGSFFSRFHNGKAFRRVKGLRCPIELAVGKPCPPEAASVLGLQNAVQALRGECA